MPFRSELDPLASIPAPAMTPSDAPSATPREPSLAELKRAATANSGSCPNCGCEMRLPSPGGWVCRHCGQILQIVD